MKCLSLASNAGILLLTGTHYVFDKDLSYVESISVSLDFLLFFKNIFMDIFFMVFLVSFYQFTCLYYKDLHTLSHYP